MPPRKTKPTEPELHILKALWRQHPLNAKVIHERTARQNNWSFSSTRKTLERMVEKGFLTVAVGEERILCFSPALTKVNTMALFIHDLTDRVLESSKPLPIHTLVDSELFDERELRELEEALLSFERTVRTTRTAQTESCRRVPAVDG